MHPTLRASPQIRRYFALFAAVVVLGCTVDERRATDAPPAASTPPRVTAPPPTPAKTAAPAPAATTDAETFWVEYREAALSGDTARLLPLVNFPFTTRGTFDSDPVRKHGRKEFPELFARLLERLIIGQEVSITERDLLFDTTRLPPEQVEMAREIGWFRVGDFEFERIHGTWKLIHGFTDEP
ncbi:MAG TPA: hypothetical protein VF705_06185 [Longimicrobium sp.]|jgi:hypothetical protein